MNPADEFKAQAIEQLTKELCEKNGWEYEANDEDVDMAREQVKWIIDHIMTVEVGHFRFMIVENQILKSIGL